MGYTGVVVDDVVGVSARRTAHGTANERREGAWSE